MLSPYIRELVQIDIECAACEQKGIVAAAQYYMTEDTGEKYGLCSKHMEIMYTVLRRTGYKEAEIL